MVLAIILSNFLPQCIDCSESAFILACGGGGAQALPIAEWFHKTKSSELGHGTGCGRESFQEVAFFFVVEKR